MEAPLLSSLLWNLLYAPLVNVIAKKSLVGFYTDHPSAKTALEVWHAEAKKAAWQSPQEIKREYPSASFLKHNRVVFNIKGNDFRLVVHIAYRQQVIYVRFIGTHSEYDKIDAEEV